MTAYVLTIRDTSFSCFVPPSTPVLTLAHGPPLVLNLAHREHCLVGTG
jgi:hypothetical protein